MKGKITKCYSIECGKCGDKKLSHAQDTKQVRRDLRWAGWSETSKFGWICPRCKTDGVVM